MESNVNVVHREPWNKGKIVGQKAPFKLKDIWALRVRLQMESPTRELALFTARRFTVGPGLQPTGSFLAWSRTHIPGHLRTVAAIGDMWVRARTLAKPN